MLHLVHWIPTLAEVPWLIMAIHCSVTYLVQMRLLSIVLLMVVTKSSVALQAEGLRLAGGEPDAAPSASYLLNDNAELASAHRKSDTPGIRLDMTRRPKGCTRFLQGSASRTQYIACALEQSFRRQRMLILGSGTNSMAVEIKEDWRFPESAGIGEFLVPIYLGTPPKKSTVIIDTGSDLTWIQSQPCIPCFEQPDPIFDPSKSSTYKKIACSTPLCQQYENSRCLLDSPCTYQIRYQGSETQGYVSTETITVERASGVKTKVPNFAFGASVYSTIPLFAITGGEGIFGLGQGNLSFPLQLGSHFGYKFSYCLVDWQSNSSATSTMYFGDAAVPKGRVMYTPFLPNPVYKSLYYIPVVGISVGASRLPINQSVFEMEPSGFGGTIIDSAITYTFLPPPAYDEIAKAYKSQVKYPIAKDSGSELSLCFNTKGVKNPTFPTMTIHLKGAHLRLPTTNTFISADNISCLAFVSYYAPFGIIGNLVQQNFDIVYDLKGKRIGFSPADCATI